MPAYQTLVAWILSTMFTLQPAYDARSCWWGVKWTDTYEHTAERFAQAAYDDPLKTRAVDGSSEGDVVFTAALEVVWAARESRFKPDAVGDSGASIGILQVNPRTAGTSREVLLDVDQAIPIAVGLFHFSFRACRDRPVEERMGQYIWGRDCEHRLDVSRARVERARTIARTFYAFARGEN
jgi:hypothetical protein